MPKVGAKKDTVQAAGHAANGAKRGLLDGAQRGRKGGEMNQDIRVDGTGNSVLASGGGKSLRIEVDGADNVVIVRSGGTLTIGARQAQEPPKTPTVKRGQVWQYDGRERYQVISVRDGLARYFVTNARGKPIVGDDGKALIKDIAVTRFRFSAWRLMGGETWQ